MFVKTPSIHLAHSQLQSTTGRKYSLGWSTRQPVVWHLLWKCMGTISNTIFLLQILPTILFGAYYIYHCLSTARHMFNINKLCLSMSVHSLLVAKESTIFPPGKNMKKPWYVRNSLKFSASNHPITDGCQRLVSSHGSSSMNPFWKGLRSFEEMKKPASLGDEFLLHQT